MLLLSNKYKQKTQLYLLRGLPILNLYTHKPDEGLPSVHDPIKAKPIRRQGVDLSAPEVSEHEGRTSSKTERSLTYNRIKQKHKRFLALLTMLL